jgi:hypothetical protein
MTIIMPSAASVKHNIHSIHPWLAEYNSSNRLTRIGRNLDKRPGYYYEEFESNLDCQDFATLGFGGTSDFVKRVLKLKRSHNVYS